MPSLQQLVPDADVLLSLEPEELAGCLLLHFQSSDSYQHKRLHLTNHVVPLTKAYPSDKAEAVKRALYEAWGSLHQQGLMTPNPEPGAGWAMITRKGERIKSPEDFRTYRRAATLPNELLHPVIANKVSGLLVRNDYDLAVFSAFKEVEVAVRQAAALSDGDYGQDLVRKAFRPDGGVLTDSERESAERTAMFNLFAGGLGLFKNPHSHRNVVLNDPREAFEMLMVASLLLRIVDARGEARQATRRKRKSRRASLGKVRGDPPK